MKRPPDGLGPIIPLDRRLAKPLHRQLYDGVRDAILDGRLRPGQRLPSTRTLARDLQISRIPVVTAFEQLAAEGYVASKVGSGSFVSAALPLATAATTALDGPRPGPRRLPRERIPFVPTPWNDCYGAFRVGQPALDQFPAELWARLVARRARMLPRRQMSYGDTLGFLPLREALAEYLGTVRSVRCTAQQIAIVSGSQHALTLAARVLLAPGDALWFEEPGYPGARDALTSTGARAVPVRVDGDGLDVAAGIARCDRARAAYVTPSHQYPLGMIMSAARRLQLLDWARRRGAWLFEDDYDGEYRYDKQPVTSLHGLDTDRRVLYVGTFSKVLFPALRVGYLVVPEDLVPRFRAVRESMDIFPAPLYQAVLHDFIADGHFARHLRRMTAAYAERRAVLVDAIERELGDGVRIAGDSAGMHLVLLLPAGTNDHEIAVRAARRGVSTLPLSTCFMARGKALHSWPGLVLGFGGTRPPELVDAVNKLRLALRG